MPCSRNVKSAQEASQLLEMVTQEADSLLVSLSLLLLNHATASHRTNEHSLTCSSTALPLPRLRPSRPRPRPLAFRCSRSSAPPSSPLPPKRVSPFLTPPKRTRSLPSILIPRPAWCLPKHYLNKSVLTPLYNHAPSLATHTRSLPSLFVRFPGLAGRVSNLSSCFPSSTPA